jgi:HEAT repeat protein
VSFPGAWRFDLLSALIGAVLALLGVGLLYAGRRPLQARYAALRGRVEQASQRLHLAAEAQYRQWLAEQLPRWIAWSALDPRLTRCLIEPTLLPLPPYPSTQIQALPPEDPVPLRQVLRTTRRLFIYGPPGSGRTGALCYLIQEALAERLDGEASPALLPLYVRLPLIEHNPIAPPEAPLLEFLGRMVPLILRPRLDGMIRTALRDGSALLLLDELDEVPSPRRPEVVRWLGRLLEAYPGLRIVVAGDHCPTQPLETIGFIALPLAPWSRADVERFLERWAEATGIPLTELRERSAVWRRNRTGRWCPADVAAALALGSARPGDPGLYDAFLERLLQEILGKTALTMPGARLVLGRVALRLLEEERFRITLEDLEQALRQTLPELAAPTARRQIDAAIEALTAPGRPIVPIDEEHGHFRHPLLQAYLAAWAVAQAGDPGPLSSHIDDPRWEAVFAFYAALGPMAGIVERILSEPDDAFHTRLLRVAEWIAVASPQAPWRATGMAALARAFLKSGLPPALRRRLAEALVRTGDRGVPVLFHKALRHPDREIRLAAVRGLGWLGQESDLPFLEQALSDPEPEIRRAAVIALEEHGTEPAMQRLVLLVLEAEEEIRVLAAEGLRNYPEGPQLLREATEEADWRVRRAAAFALAGFREEWARARLETLAREDREWLVRSAAQDALARWTASREPAPPDLRPVVLEQLGWLIEWAVREGEGIGGGSARQSLCRALERGEAEVRRAALLTLARIGEADDLAAIRPVAFDPQVDALTRDLALRALEAIARRTGARVL